MIAATSARLNWPTILATALAPAIWGTTYIVTTQWLPPDRPITAATLRVLPAGLLLVLFTRHLPKASDWGRLLVLSALNIGIFQALLFVAAYRLPGGLAAVVGALQPLVVLSIAGLVDRRIPPAAATAAGLLGVCGMAVMILSPRTSYDLLGFIAAFAGTTCMASATFLARRWRLDIPQLALSGWQLLLGGLMLVPVALVSDPPLPALSSLNVLGYAYLCIVGALLAYTLWFHGVARLQPVAVSSLALLSPITAVILGWTLLGQSMTPITMLGLVIVLGSILTMQWITYRRA